MASLVSWFRGAPVQPAESQPNPATQLAEEFFAQCRHGSKELKKWLSGQDQQAIADSIRNLPNDHADIHQLLTQSWHAVHYAAKYGVLELFKALVEKGVNLNVRSSEDQTPLFFAVYNKEHPEVLKYLLTFNEIEIDVPTKTGVTALWAAAAYGKTDVVNELIARSANPNAVKKAEGLSIEEGDGWTVLHCAAQYGDLEMVKAIVEAGAELNAKTDKNQTSLYLASRNNGHPEVHHYLLSLGGIDVDKLVEGSGTTALLWATENNNTDAVKTLLARGANPTAMWDHGWTVLHCAAQYGDLEMVEALVEAGAGLNAKTNEGETPLYAASQNEDHPEVLRHLLSLKGVEIDAPTKDGTTVCWSAARNGNTDVVKALAARGANPNAVYKEDGWTVLHCAARYGDLEMVKAVVDAGADLNPKTNEGETSLFLASQNKEHPEVLNYLLSLEGIEVDAPMQDGTTACWTAARNSNTDAVKALVDRGANPNAVNKEDGWTVLHCASQYGDLEMVKAIVAARADLNPKTENDQTLLQLAALNEEHPEILRYLLTLKDIDVDETRENGTTALWYAARNSNTDAVKALVARSANPNAVYKEDGWTALHCAARYGDLDMVKALVVSGAGLNAKTNEGDSPLILAAWNKKHPEVLLYLVSIVEDINIREVNGVTPLHLAARNQGVAGVLSLLKAGADPNTKTKEGVTPLIAAQEHENPEEQAKIIALLKKYGATEEGNETTPTAAFPSAPWLDIKTNVRSSDRTFQTDKTGFRHQSAFTLDGKNKDLYRVDGRLRLKSFAVMTTAPVYGLANSVIQLASIVYDTALIAYSAIKNFASHLGSGKIKEAFKALVGYGIITAIVHRTYRAIISPFVGVAMSFASMYGLVSPNNGRKALNTLSNQLNDNQRYLGAFGLERVGNLGEKVHGLPKYARRA